MNKKTQKRKTPVLKKPTDATLGSPELVEVLEFQRWRKYMEEAVGGDASRLARIVVHKRVPVELRDAVYLLLLDAPWARQTGRPRQLNRVDRDGLRWTYRWLLMGLLWHNGKPVPKNDIVPLLCTRYGVSKTTVYSAIKNVG
jgi:hypothetical protein